MFWLLFKNTDSKKYEILIRWKWPEPLIFFFFFSARSGSKRNQLTRKNPVIIAELLLIPGDCMFRLHKLTDFKALSYQDKVPHSHIPGWVSFTNQCAWLPLFNPLMLLEHSLPALNLLDPSVGEGSLIHSPQKWTTHWITQRPESQKSQLS